LLGTTLNTHGAWIGGELLKLGLRVRRQVTVPDGEAIGDELKRALVENDVILVSGGLGPTSDDLTREETARALGLDLIEDEFAVRTIKDFFSSRNMSMAECNLKQAFLPCGADVIPNPQGTAPGVYIPPRLGEFNCAVFLLPGPPSELRPMVLNEVIPRLQALTEDGELSEMLVMKFFSVGESDFHAVLDDDLSAIAGLEVGYCARPGDIDLRLIGNKAAIAEARSLVVKNFGEKCYSEADETIEQVVVKTLSDKGMKICTAESCTGGAIAARLTDVSGASKVFDRGYVTYANSAKSDLLGVSNDDIESNGAVSEEVAAAMAEGALKDANADIAVAVTGIAGPSGGTEDKPVGTVWISIALKSGETITYKEYHSRGREIFKIVVVQRILAKVWQLIREK